LQETMNLCGNRESAIPIRLLIYRKMPCISTVKQRARQGPHSSNLS